jgi:hypothetical protein
VCDFCYAELKRGKGEHTSNGRLDEEDDVNKMSSRPTRGPEPAASAASTPAAQLEQRDRSPDRASPVQLEAAAAVPATAAPTTATTGEEEEEDEEDVVT